VLHPTLGHGGKRPSGDPPLLKPSGGLTIPLSLSNRRVRNLFAAETPALAGQQGCKPIRNPSIVRRRLIQAALLIGIITLPSAVALLLWAALKPLF
jgi:hypothetical protein